MSDAVATDLGFRPGALNQLREKDCQRGSRKSRMSPFFFPILNLHAQDRIIETTREHPFFVVERANGDGQVGWLSAAFLQPGDLLVSHDGQIIRVEGAADSGRVTTVYNLEIEDCHTYFVGTQEWGFSVWAHNADEGCKGKQSKDSETPTVSREFEKGSFVPGMGKPKLRGESLKTGRPKLKAAGFDELEHVADSSRVTFRKVEPVPGGQRTHEVHFDSSSQGDHWHKYTTDKHGQVYELNDRGYVDAFGTQNPIPGVHIAARN
jgi:hypothetical protein